MLVGGAPDEDVYGVGKVKVDGALEVKVDGEQGDGLLSHLLAQLWQQPLWRPVDLEAFWVVTALLAWQAEEDQVHRDLELEFSSHGGAASPHHFLWSSGTTSFVLSHLGAVQGNLESAVG